MNNNNQEKGKTVSRRRNMSVQMPSQTNRLTKPKEEFVRVADFQMWNMSPSMFVGKSPKCHMACGKCFRSFSKRFSPSDFSKGHPKAMCPNCYQVNYVPISYG